MPVPRPGVFRWVFYAFGGRLDQRYAQWVLHDLTCRWWLLRHAGRTVVQCLPALLLLLLPGPWSLRIYLPLLVLLGGLFVSLSFAWEARNQRLYQHGFVPEMVLPREDDDEEED